MATINDIQNQILTPIANAIRTKEGSTEKIPNSQLASRIENLQTGAEVVVTKKSAIEKLGTYDKIFFNKSLTSAEITSICDSLELPQYGDYYLFYSTEVEASNNQPKYIVKIKKPAYWYEIQIIVGGAAPTVIWTGVGNGQWNISTNYYSFSTPQTGRGSASIGSKNELLKDLIYVEEHIVKHLEETYDGSAVEVTEAGVVDIGAMIDEGKLPLEVNVNIETPVIEGTIEITENGTYDVSTYASANVNVASGGSGEGNPLQELINMKTDWSSLFANAKVTNLDIFNGIDTSHITNMNKMFYYCSSLTRIPSTLKTDSATNTSYMFGGCSNLEYIPELNTSNSTNFEYMYYGCNKLTTIPALNTSKATILSYVFSNCYVLEQIPQIDISKATSCNALFKDCRKIKNINFSLNFNSTTNATSVFENCYELESIPTLNLTKLQNISRMFYACKKLTAINLENTQNITNYYSTFSQCESLVTLETIDCNNVSSDSYAPDFYRCYALQNLKILNIRRNLTLGMTNNPSYTTLLTTESLIGVIKELINMGTTKKLTLGAEYLEKIANIYVKFIDSSQTSIATNEKGNVEICESTDENAMLLTDYATLKNWTLL